MADCARLSEGHLAVWQAAWRALARCCELNSYLANNVGSVVNYGSRERQGPPLSTFRAEDCVDDIGNTRMGNAVERDGLPKVPTT